MDTAEPREEQINAVAWLLWLCGVVALPLISRNPLYLSLVLLATIVVYLSLPRRGPTARAWRLFALIGVTLAVISIGFNVLTVHVGDRTFATLPEALPIIGGKLTWNAFVYGVVRALAIAALLIGATAFNTAVRHGDLVRLMPGSLARLGIAGSIALTMVPQTIAAGRDIIDAQRARGHRVRGVRDAGSIVVPLLSVGMERALTLSEALEVRGFGASSTAVAPHGPLAFLPAFAGLVAALVALGLGQMWLGLLALAVTLLLAAQAAPRATRRTRLRGTRWNRASLAVAAGAVATLLVLFSAGAFLGISFAWEPFPRLVAPEFDPLIGAAVFGLLVPAVVANGRAR
jgi:energy-coupling factor transport system permease protein